MTIVDTDVVIVGAGPVGSHVARLLALQGLDVLMVEEHDEIGQPVQCAGLVTPRVFAHAPFAIGNLWQNDLHGATMYAPNGRSVSFATKQPHAIAMDRAGFDQHMAKAAAEAGVTIFTGTKAVGMRIDASGATVALQGKRNGTIRCALVIGADGIRSRVAHWAGLPSVKEVVSAYEAELSGCHIADVRMIPMFAGSQQAPGFFSWIIPVGGDRVRAGLAVAPGMNEQAARAYYQAMFVDSQSAPFLAGAKEEYLIIGGIPLGLRSQLVADRVAVVGDAAGMAKPTSGGGIWTGLVGAEHMARIAGPLVKKDHLTAGHLRPYQRLVKRTIAKELRRGWLLRAFYKRMQDGDFNELARLLDRDDTKRVIEHIGDIDHPSKLVWPLLRARPELFILAARVLLRSP